MKKYAFGVDIGGTTVKMGFLRQMEHCLTLGKYLQEHRKMASIYLGI